jgi:hypothetical protein
MLLVSLLSLKQFQQVRGHPLALKKAHGPIAINLGYLNEGDLLAKALVGNASDSDQVEKAKEKEKHGRDLEINDMRFILSTPQGRRTLWRYLSHCGIYQSSFRTSSEIYYLEGQRAVGLEILKDIHDSDSEAYVKMINENKKEK